MNKTKKVLNEIEKLKGKKKDRLEQHPHIIESRKHWGWDAGYENYDPITKENKKDEV